MFLVFDVKNGVKYARFVKSKRVDGKVRQESMNIGRVLDESRLIFASRERGVFTFDPATGQFGAAPSDFVPALPRGRGHEQLLLDFGDAFIVTEFLDRNGMMAAVEAIGYGNPDTLKAMLLYYILCSTANCHAASWWEGSYARLLFPNADLRSQRVSDFLIAIGDEYSQREFFGKYLSLLGAKEKEPGNILIDSTGLPNSVHFPLTAISNHNGEISSEVRLIYVIHQTTGLPIYFRYCPGNVIDVTTLARTIEELRLMGVNTKFSVMDAGYYDQENLGMLFENGISFIMRLRENFKLYRELVATHGSSLAEKPNLVQYNDRYVYIKCVECLPDGKHHAYAYIGLDVSRRNDEAGKLFKRARRCSMTTDDVHDAMATQGMFIIIASRRIARDRILPAYYSRQQIEQVFDIGKNYADFLPVRVQTEEAFRGHLLLTFMAAVAVKLIQDKLKDSPYNPISMLLNMRNQKCKVYENAVIPQEAYKKANDCYKLLGVECPVKINRSDSKSKDAVCK